MKKIKVTIAYLKSKEFQSMFHHTRIHCLAEVNVGNGIALAIICALIVFVIFV